MSISQLVIKKLYGRSAGRCNICNRELVEENVQIGEMAHVIAKSSMGPRGSASCTNDNSYENLILLCSIHHKIVDTKPDEYPVNRLHEIKQQHENNIQNRLSNNRGYQEDLQALNILFQFIPIVELLGMAMKLPQKVSMRFQMLNTFRDFCIGHPHLYPFKDGVLVHKWCELMSTIDALECWIEGSLKGTRLVNMSDVINLGHDNEMCYDIYVANVNGDMILNKSYLSSEQLDLVHNEVPKLVQIFVWAHKDLIDYIRNQFNEIVW